jgi:hypothetical protein
MTDLDVALILVGVAILFAGYLALCAKVRG